MPPQSSGRQKPERKADAWVSYVVTPQRYAEGLETIEAAAREADRTIGRFVTRYRYLFLIQTQCIVCTLQTSSTYPNDILKPVEPTYEYTLCQEENKLTVLSVLCSCVYSYSVVYARTIPVG